MLELSATIVHQVCPNLQLSNVPEGSSGFLFPNAMDVYDHLHILQNALQDGVESLEWWEDFLEPLRACIVFVR